MGWGYNNKCFDTVDLAKTSFVNDFGIHTLAISGTSNPIIWEIPTFSAVTVTAAGKLTIPMRATTVGGSSLQSAYFQLSSCTVSDSSSYDYLAAAAMFNFAFIGVFSLWYLAKNLGHITNSVKRFFL